MSLNMKYFSFANASISKGSLTYRIFPQTVRRFTHLLPFTSKSQLRKKLTFLASGIKLVWDFNEAFLSLTQVHKKISASFRVSTIPERQRISLFSQLAQIS